MGFDDILLVLVVLAAVGGGLWWWLQQRRKEAARPPEPQDIIGEADKYNVDQLKQLRTGDVVHYEAENWFLRGTIDFDEHGYTWSEHMLDDADRKRWLCVEDDEGFEVSLWHTIAEGDIEQGGPGDRDVIVGGIAYRLQEQGTATFTANGSTGTAPTGTVKYADYKSVDGRLLGFENFGGRWEASLGEVLQPWELTVFPSTDRPGSL